MLLRLLISDRRLVNSPFKAKLPFFQHQQANKQMIKYFQEKYIGVFGQRYLTSP